jgi:segregation and condensation protein B
MDDTEIKYFVEAALVAAGRPLNIDQLQGLFDDASAPDKSVLRKAIKDLQEEYESRGLQIAEVASGFRLQIKSGMAERLDRLWEEKPPRYSRAMFETLALIAYRQPMTRGEIEEIRGVSVSSNIVRSLLEREWVRVVGHRDVPGRPAMFATTRQFLDYFGLKKLDDLPPLADLSDWESLRVQLNLPAVDEDDAAVAQSEAEELANVPEIPVLYPDEQVDAANDEADPDAEAVAAAEALVDADFEELVATEWPDPGAQASDTSTADIAEEEKAEAADADASASGS